MSRTIKEVSEAVLRETERVVFGKHDKLRLILTAVLADGHVLLTDLPGVGKTTIVKSLSRALGCQSGRIQFVPDLLPSDILGMQIFNQKTGDFELRHGPVMTNLLLADEINRAIPRTQSALLEAMEERQVSIDRETFSLPKPFIVLATQNPVESESTFHLPAAQMDRFLICLSVGYPSAQDERHMLEELGDRVGLEAVQSVTNGEEVIALQQEAHKVFVSDAVAEYIVAITAATRTHPRLQLGASPRASRGLYKAAKVWAAMEGRTFVTPDDVQALAGPVLVHRLVPTADARFSGVDAETILNEILTQIPVPSAKGAEHDA